MGVNFKMCGFQSGGSARLRDGVLGSFGNGLERRRPAPPLGWTKTCYFTPHDLFPPFQKREGQSAKLETTRPKQKVSKNQKEILGAAGIT